MTNPTTSRSSIAAVGSVAWESETHVFAYGSNLHLRRMRSRVPSADIVAVGYVSGRQLLFHKRSVDGSAKADAFYSGDPVHRVWGVVYRMDAAGKRVLDQFEQLGVGYDQQQVDVDVDGSPVPAWIYTACPAAIDRSLRPYRWYRDFVLYGAFQHRLPFCYIANHVNVESTRDPDVSRRNENAQLIGSSFTTGQ